MEAMLANLWYGFPSRRVTVIGVTGTDGKTTTTSLIYHILKKSGKKAAMVTSVGAYIGDKLYDIGFHVTTPSSFAVQKYIKQAADSGNEYVILETTSHALDQYRVWGISYQVAVLTNITHEHLDYHKTYEDYVQTKGKLLRMAKTCVVNKDDRSYTLVASDVKNKEVVTYSLADQTATLTPKKFPFIFPLMGEFNMRNCLAAIGACQVVGIPDNAIRSSLNTFTPPPGRQEIVYQKNFMVMIDFAHTPNAFAQILPEVKKQTKGRLIHVFGSASERDTSKRPFMGEESARYDDIIILTAEDSRKESIESICREIAAGIKGFKEYEASYFPKKEEQKLFFIIHDRKKAIEKAIAIAQKGDSVIVTGKSHEKSINYGQGEEPWDEFAVVSHALHMKLRK